MIPNIESLAQLGGTVITVIAFLYYMNKKDVEFNKTIQNHLVHSNQVIDKNSDAMIKISNSLEELCVLVRKDNKGEQGERGKRGKPGKNK